MEDFLAILKLLFLLLVLVLVLPVLMALNWAIFGNLIEAEKQARNG